MGQVVTSRRRTIVVTLMILVSCGCGKPAPPKRFDSLGDPLPAHAVLRLGSVRFLPICSRIDRIQYSADGKYVATMGFEQTGTVKPAIHIWERQTGKDVTPGQLKEMNPSGIAWAHSGHRFITSHADADLPWGLVVWTVGSDGPQILQGKGVRVSSAAWSPTGDRIAVRTWDQNCLVLDERGNERLRLPFPDKTYHASHAIAFSPDGKWIAIPSETGVRIFDSADGKSVLEIPFETEYLNVIRFLPDGQSIGVGTGDGLLVFELENVDRPRLQLGEKAVLDFAISPDQKWIASTGFGLSKNLTIWDRRTGDKVFQYEEASDGGVDFSPDGSELAISTRRISFLETRTWKQQDDGNGHYNMVSSGLVLGDQLWTGEFGPNIYQWDLSHGNLIKKRTLKSGTAISLAKVDRDRVAVAGGVPEIDILDVHLNKKATSTYSGHRPFTGTLVYASQHERLISAAFGKEGDDVIRVWDLKSAKPALEIPIQTGTQNSVYVRLAVAPDGDSFACGNCVTGRVHLYQTADGSELWDATIGMEDTVFLPMAFLPDSSQLAIVVLAPGKHPGELAWAVRFLETESGNEVFRLDCNSTSVYAIAVSPDASLVALSTMDEEDHNRIEIWSLKNQRLVATLSGHNQFVSWLQFLPDRKRLISLSSQDTTALVWDVEEAIRCQRIQ